MTDVRDLPEDGKARQIFQYDIDKPAEPAKPDPSVLALDSDFRCSEGIGKLVEALSKAQLEFLPIKKTVVNEFYSTEKKVSRYADLSDIIAATQKALASHGLVVMQWPVVDAETHRAGSVSRLAHTSGEWTQCTILLPATEKRKEYKKDGSFEWVNQFTAQTCGIAMTYSRRYSYQAVICVAAEVDDDANSISVHDQGSTETQKAVAERKIKEIAAKMGKKTEPKEDGNRCVFILEWPEDKEGDVLITAPAGIIADMNAPRKPANAIEGQENHRLIKYSLMTKFYDLAASKNIIVKDLAQNAVQANGD